MTDVFRPVVSGVYHGVLHNTTMDILSFRMPKSACSTLRKFFISSVKDFEYRSDWKNDGIDILGNYEIFQDLSFDDSDEYFNHPDIADTPLIIFFRDPLERLCSAISEYVKVGGLMPGDEIHNNVFRTMYHHYMEKIHAQSYLYNLRPQMFEQQLIDNFNSHSDNLYEFIWSFMRQDHTPKFISDNHLTPQSYWLEPVQKVKQDIVYFEVDDYLTENFNHYLKSRSNTDLVMTTSRQNDSRQNSYQTFVKNYIRPMITNPVLDHPFHQQAKEIYQTDLEMYESLKPQFYRAGEQELLKQNDFLKQIVNLGDN